MELKIAEVIVDDTSRSVDRLFHYEIPSDMQEQIKIGMRVEVPFGFGNRKKNGFVVGFSEKSDVPHLKAIARTIDREPVINEESAALAKWIRSRYFCSFWEALRLFVPPGTMMRYVEMISLTDMPQEEREEKLKRAPNQAKLVDFLVESGGTVDETSIRDWMKQDVGSLISALIEKKIVERTVAEYQTVRDKTVVVYSYCGEVDAQEYAGSIEKRSPAQARVVELLGQCECLSAMDITLFAGVTRSVISALEKKGIIEKGVREVYRKPSLMSPVEPDAPKKLTDEQEAALSAIEKALDGASHTSFLLHGVTGSGKTEVFMQAIAHVLKAGKTALVLVPEISLTPQMTRRFTARFGDKIAILHSALSMGERLDEWKRIKNGEATVVIGARSAVFAPLQNIGIIIVDEEHETSYKSEMAPRYHAIEVAKKRSEENRCVLLLASATPSLQSMYRAKSGEYHLLALQKRYNEGKLPEVSIVDMGEELREGNRSVISRRLKEEIEINLENKEQTILFLNRRGFSTFVSCRNCGYVMTCENCNISMTYHSFTDTLDCHYCGTKIKNPTLCPSCGSKHIRYFGAGTERIEQELHELFPSASIVRMDVDTTSGKGGHERVLHRFSEQKADILLGTQMVAKGLDYPEVTLVGVLAADTLLNIDDYRAGERTFDLITQVCGRAGRGAKEGRAVIQTYTPESPVLKLAAEQNYDAFYDSEINYRKLFCYPPFCDIIHIIMSSEDAEKASTEMNWFASVLRGKIRQAGKMEDVQIFGPADAPIGKIKRRYRRRMWLKIRFDDTWQEILQTVLEEYYNGKYDASIAIDVNPNSMI